MSPLTQHMEREFRLAGLMSGTDAATDKLVSDIRALVALYISQNHSGGSASQTLTLFDRLVSGYPLTPLYGGRQEWTDVSPDGEPGKVFQNVRYSKVFWNKEDGHMYDTGMCPHYMYPDGTVTTRPDDKPPQIIMPYMPGVGPIIPVDENGNRLTDA